MYLSIVEIHTHSLFLASLQIKFKNKLKYSYGDKMYVEYL